MTQYLSQLKELLSPKLTAKGYKLFLMGSTLKIMKGMQTVMNIVDKGEEVELSFKGQKYKYDKWYTKPEHLAKTILRVFEVQQL
ncbi:MAG: hypothetical protein GXO09_02270 [Crenarchaeota archaeon]|nr:hypothetical protein [Thermoproteota archaeon]